MLDWRAARLLLRYREMLLYLSTHPSLGETNFYPNLPSGSRSGFSRSLWLRDTSSTAPWYPPPRHWHVYARHFFVNLACGSCLWWTSFILMSFFFISLQGWNLLSDMQAADSKPFQKQPCARLDPHVPMRRLLCPCRKVRQGKRRVTKT